MSEHCLHEQDIGKMKADILTTFKRIDELKEDMSCLKEQNIAIAKINVNLEHLVREVKDNNGKFHQMFSDHSMRIDIMEHSEGDYLKALSRRAKEDVVRYIAVGLASGIAGILISGVFP